MWNEILNDNISWPTYTVASENWLNLPFLLCGCQCLLNAMTRNKQNSRWLNDAAHLAQWPILFSCVHPSALENASKWRLWSLKAERNSRTCLQRNEAKYKWRLCFIETEMKYIREILNEIVTYSWNINVHKLFYVWRRKYEEAEKHEMRETEISKKT